MITIILNGLPRQVEPVASVAALLDAIGQSGRPVLVERNGTALFSREFATTPVESGDRFEIIELAAGG